MSAPTGCETLQVSEAPHVIRNLPVLILMTHSRCNCRCVMCDIWKKTEHQEFTSKDLRPHLQSIRDLNVGWVVFSGGEPLMNRGLFELAQALREMGIRLTLLSTGLLLEKYGNEIATYIDEVIVSLDGPAGIHDAIRRVPGAFDTMAAGVSALRRLAPQLPIRARTTVQAANHRHLRETVAAAKRLGFDSISFLAADVTSSAFNRELLWPIERRNEIALGTSEVETLEREIAALVVEYPDEINSGFIVESPAKLERIVEHFRAELGMMAPRSPHCNAPWTSAVVDADGSVRPCFFHQPIGHLQDGSLLEVLNSEQAVHFRQSLQIDSNPTCQRCVCSLNYRPTTSPERTPGS